MEKSKYEFLRNELRKVAEQLYREFVEKHPKENVCGFSIYSDESAMSVSVAINTRKHLEQKIKREPDYAASFRFWTNEWAYQSLESKGLGELNTVLQEAHFAIPERQFAKHREEIFGIMVDVLDELKNERLFDGLREDFILLFASTDFLNLEMAIGFARRLNSETIAREYEAWVKDGESDDDDLDDDIDWDKLDKDLGLD
jgi:hypothetical protein